MIRARQNLSMILSIVLAALLVSWAVINIKGCVAALTWHQMSVHIWQPTTITYTINYSGATPQAMLYLKEDRENNPSSSDADIQSSPASLGTPVDIAHNDNNTLTLSADVTPGQATLNYRTLGATDIKISQELTPNIDTVIRHASIINPDSPNNTVNPAVSFTTFIAPGINRNIELTATISLLDDTNNKHDLGSHVIHANEATTLDVFDADHPIASVPQGKYRCLLTITGNNPEITDGRNNNINAAAFVGNIDTVDISRHSTTHKAGQ